MTPGSQRVDCCDGMVAFELSEAGSTDHSDLYGSWVRMLESALLGKPEDRWNLPWKWVGRGAIVRCVVGKFVLYVANEEGYEWLR